MQTPDKSLIQKLTLQENTEVFTEITNRYAGFVYSVCYRILEDHERAEDAAQDTFFQLLRKPESITYSLSGWLHKVATRTAIDVIRKDSSRQRRENDYASMNTNKASKWEDISPYIDKALAGLDEESKEVLIQHFLQGKRQEIIAIELGISQATVSRKIKTGLEKLKKQLKKKGIIISAVLLGTLLKSGLSEAAPLGFLSELGKMAMFNKVSELPVIGKSTSYSVQNIKRVFNFKSISTTSIIIVGIVIWLFLCLKGKDTNSEVALTTTECIGKGNKLEKQGIEKSESNLKQPERIGTDYIKGSSIDTGLVMGDEPVLVPHIVNVRGFELSVERTEDEIRSDDKEIKEALFVGQGIKSTPEFRTENLIKEINLKPLNDSFIIDSFVDTIHRSWMPRVNKKTLDREEDIPWNKTMKRYDVKKVK